MKKFIMWITASCMLTILQPPVIQAQVRVGQLRCEMLNNPLGIDVLKPRLSWEISSGKRNVRQTGYHILVASTAEKLKQGDGDLWDSGLVQTNQSVFVPYNGQNLESRKVCFWKVRIETNKGNSNWSSPASWSMGLLNPADWKAKWVGLDTSFAGDQPDSVHTRLSARYFRKEFLVGKTIRKATVYLSGLGLYELSLNGKKVGDQVLSPSPTDYTKSIKYNTYDLTKVLKKGHNSLGMTLGNGRFFTMRYKDHYYPPGRHWLYNNKQFGFPKLILQLEITYTNGTRDTILSDEEWKVTAQGPIRSNNEFDGEEYDARRELKGWDMPGYNDQGWLQAEQVKAPGGVLNAQINRNIKVMQTLVPQSIKKSAGGMYILDMGQNMVGWLKMKVKGKSGECVKLRFAETLKPDGSLYMANIREALVTDLYTLKGETMETWEPRFTYHGFRYVEISGYPGIPTVADFEGKVIYDEMETTGSFETSDSTLNQIYHNAYWGIRGNYRGMPTDCPQRDERQGWLGDRTTGSLGESFLFNNHNLYAKWLDDIEQAQLENGSIPDVAPNYWDAYNDNMTWPAAYIHIANMLYEQYGDLQPIARHYASMKKWLDYMRDNFMKNHIMTKDTYGDWCVPPERLNIIFSEDPSRKTDGTLLGTAFYYRIAGMMERFAGLLGKQADAADFSSQAAAVKEAFNLKYLNRESGYYINNTITANLIPLCFGLVPTGYEDGLMQHISEKTKNVFKGHVGVGLIGIQWLMRGLSEHGRADLALRIASNREYPGWGYMVSQGATTIWELWNGNTADPSMNSGNHVMLLGDLLTWYYQNLAGIRNEPGSIGFQRITMQPSFEAGLQHVSASYHSVHGQILSSWKKDNESLQWTIVVPCNTTATVKIPAAKPDQITESGRPAQQAEGVQFIKMEGKNAVFELGSGTYTIRVNN